MALTPSISERQLHFRRQRNRGETPAARLLHPGAQEVCSPSGRQPIWRLSFEIFSTTSISIEPTRPRRDDHRYHSRVLPWISDSTVGSDIVEASIKPQRPPELD